MAAPKTVYKYIRNAMQKMGLKSGYNMRYTKHSSNKKIPLIKHVQEVKINPLLVRTKVQKQQHQGLPRHTKMGPKRGNKGKYNMEVPNSVEPFFNVEEGRKIILLSVYNMLQN